MRIAKPLLTFGILLGFSASLTAQDIKNIAITNFNGLTVSNGIDVSINQSNTESIKVSAHPDLLKNVIVDKEGSILSIRYKDNASWSRFIKGQGIKVYVNCKTLQSITASGGSDILAENNIKTDRLSITASGGSDIDLNVNTKELKIVSSGGSDIDLKGMATNLSVTSTGGSDIDALELRVEYAKVTSSGGSDVNIYVTKALEANATGGSDIQYKGDASVRKTSSNKSGDVRKIQ